MARLPEPAANSSENGSSLVEPPAGSIILAAENSPGSWVPAEADIAVVESDLAMLFANPDKRFEEAQGARLSEYLVRYYGAVRGGRTVIVGEGTHVSEMDMATFKRINSQPGSVLLPAFGGGRTHFTAIYDPAEKKIASLRFNAAL